MKKVGIISTSYAGGGTFGCNYGAALQGYALTEQLRLMGYDAYELNYISENEYQPIKYGPIKRTLKRIKYLFNIKLVTTKIKYIKNADNIKIVNKKFKSFIEDNNITYQKGKFFKFDELKNISSDFFAFVTGSDVVWNPYLHGNVNDEGFFLDFVREDVKRIAYSPSFGVTELPQNCAETLPTYLDKFDAISVREASGAKIVQKCTGKNIPVVLDPTLLLPTQNYEKIMRKPDNIPDEYILVYKFGNIDHTSEKIEEISKKTKLPCVYVPTDMSCKNSRYDIGPGEFIWLVQNAKLVISDSFHCTVFCLIYNTPFLTFYRNLLNEKKNINSRMTDLLKKFNMSERMIEPGQSIAYDNLMNMDFSVFNQNISVLREESLNYLKNSLGE